MSAKPKTINNVGYITATVASKPVTISEASIRSDLLFDDVDGIYTLNNQAIFDTIQLMGPSPSIPISDSNPEGSGANHGDQSSSNRSLSGNGDGLTLQSIKKLKKKASDHTPQSLDEECFHEDKIGRKEIYDQAFDDLDDFDVMDYIETEDAHNEKGVSNEDQVSTPKPDEGTDKPKVSTDKIDEGTAELKNENSNENATPTATPTVFRDDETIVEPLNNDLAKEEATKATLIKDYDDIQARIEADSILATRLQEEEREKFTIKERAKLLHDTIDAQR
ncbi:hypothetical protein Tco_0384882 [Tanacetum coccineum]